MNNQDILYNYILDAKKTLRLLITKQCNLKCAYCYEEGIEKSTNTTLQKLDLNDFKNIILAAKKLGVYRVSFSGGEPTLYSAWLDELISLCQKLGIISTVTTNGLSSEIIKLAQKYPTLNIRVSLDFANQADYSFYKGVNAFDKVVSNLKELIKLPNPININRIVFSLDNEWEEFNKMIDFLVKNKLNKDNIYLKLLPSYPNDTFNKLSTNKLHHYFINRGVSFKNKHDELRNKNKPFFEYRGVKVIIQNRGVYSPKCCISNENRCTEGIGSVRVNPNGLIQPCLGTKLGFILHNNTVDAISAKLKESHDFLDSLYISECSIVGDLLNI